MEKVIKNKSQCQYLSLIVKKISKDRLSKKELETYENLKYSIDPSGSLEDELTNAWSMAENNKIADSVNFELTRIGKTKFTLKQLFKRIIPFKYLVKVGS